VNNQRRPDPHELRWPLGAAILVAVAAGGCGQLVRTGHDQAALVAGGLVALLAALGVGLLIRQLGRARVSALTDPLTGLPNRVLLDDRVEQALRRARRSSEAFGLFVIDLDGFKEVNDVRGHEAGNQVLRAIARRLESVIRESDTVARVGGDEFVVLSLGTRTEDEAATLVGRLRHALRRPYRVDGHVVEVDASIGWALFPDDGATPQELLGRADGQMYATKRDASDETSERRAALDAGIVREYESALQRAELVVHYQPQLNLSSGSVRSMEALVRRVHPGKGLVSPADFIPHVERTPLIRALTMHVLRDALANVKQWDQIGHRVGVSVNVPYRVLDDPQLVDGVSGLLASTGIAPELLTLEIVPSGPGAGAALDLSVVEKLTASGVRLSLDDFGRASSLVSIRSIPLDEVKIDGAFVHRLRRRGTDAEIVRALVTLAHALGLTVVAEGIETREAWDAAGQLGCDVGQGFYILPPRPSDEISEWLQTSWPVAALAS
jgi:diguanylate cyclase (GGDEF)-like protein